MITSFADQTTRDIFEGLESKAARKIPKNLWSTARRKLDQINAVLDVNQLRLPPGNQFHALKDALEGFFSVRVNDQFRVIFRFDASNATDVSIVDYH